MTNTPSDYSSNADHGDETDARPKETSTMSGKSNTQYTLTGAVGDAPGPWVGRFDAAYWQAQAEQAQAERDAALRQVTALVRQVVEAEGRATALRDALAHCNRLLTHDATQRVHGRRDA